MSERDSTAPDLRSTVLKGHVAPIQPTLVLRAYQGPLNGLWTVAVGARTLSRHVTVPVSVLRQPHDNVHEELRVGWSRSPLYYDLPAFAAQVAFAMPLLVSARHRWRLSTDRAEVLERAVLIDGAARLAWFSQRGDRQVLASVLTGLHPEDELLLRRSLTWEHSSPLPDAGHDSPTDRRLKISYPESVCVEFLSDPYVRTTAFGYAPAVDVRVLPHSEEQLYVLCSAKSLALGLLSVQNGGESLVGLKARISKQEARPTAPYVVEPL